jgi:membrane protease YdiL (CAAX protease family)
MHIITDYLRTYFKDEWNPKLFIGVGILLATLFVSNYGVVSEASVIRSIPNPLHQFVAYFFYYGIPFVVTLAMYSRTTGKREFYRDKKFISLTLFCFIVLSAYITLHNIPLFLLRTTPSLLADIPKELHWYALRYASNLLPGLVVLPLWLYWLKNDKDNSRFYGFSSSNINLNTYFGIILLLAPIVLAASYTSDFQFAYPRLKFGLPQSVGGTERALLVSGFEVCYGVDFVFVELVFRGFMVMAFARSLGSASILPMVVVYAMIHFQKPIGEAIGSIVGGLVLGVIAYRTKSIYGGIILHLGIAYLMEIAGAVQLAFH